MQYAVHEPDAERAEEIAGEFYPNGDSPLSEPVDSLDGPNEEDEQLARICDLARRLGYNEAKTKMKLGQWAGKLAGLEAELSSDLEGLVGQLPRDGREAKQNGADEESNNPAHEMPRPMSQSPPTRPEEQTSPKGFLF